MGVYLSTASTEKFSTDKCVGSVTYGASSMQGWRKSQEDAHNCCPEFDSETNTLLFAVYDGHGGAEVAEYASRHLPDIIKQTKLYQENNLPDALIQAFLDFDASLIEESAQKELLSIAQLDKVESADEDEAEMLNEEAEKPIEEVLENYGGVQQLPEDIKNVFQKNKKFQKIKNQQFESPALRPRCNGAKKSDSDEVNASNGLNGHLDENENGKCSRVESTTSEKTSKADDPVSSSDDVISSSEAETNGDNEATPLESPKPETSADQEEKEDNAEPSSSNLPDEEEEEDDDEEDEEEEEAWSDTSSEEEEEEEECCHHGDEEDGEMMATFNEEEKPGYDSGCTAVVALLRDRQLHVANAGDSRCVLCRAGKAVDLSLDHKPEDEPELTRIKNAGGMVSFDGRVNGGLNLSRALGDHIYKGNDKFELKDQMISGLPDVKSVDIEDDDEFVILACDGIWNSMTSQEVVDFVKEKIEGGMEKMSQICEELFEHCLAPDTSGDGTGCDNMTAVIIRLNHAHTGSGDAHSGRGVKRSAADSPEDTSSKRSRTSESTETG